MGAAIIALLIEHKNDIAVKPKPVVATILETAIMLLIDALSLKKEGIEIF